MPETDRVFSGSIPAAYDRYLRPLIFEPFAADLARRLADLRAGGLLQVAAGDCRSPMRRSMRSPVSLAQCSGSPLRNELEARGPGRVAEATESAATFVRQRFGAGPISGKMQAHVVMATR